jgi:3'-phosphoadenosine 5'-phosphosulfate sulfotransferase (PAPS reductase)/FAD synthetase
MGSIVKVVVPISGGKDSQTCLKLALESHAAENVRGLFCDTQFEHPKTYVHVKWMSEHYGVQIDRVCEGSVEEKCIRHKRFPNGGARHCTEELKIVPSKKYYSTLADTQNAGFEVWLGLRSDESTDRRRRYAGVLSDEIYKPNDLFRKYPKYLNKKGVWFRLPILDWSKGDVLEYLNGEENPLYGEGFDRVGCFPCLAGGDKWKEKAFQHDDFGRQQRVIVMKLEDTIGRSCFDSKGALRRESERQALSREGSGSGCAICAI